MGDNDPRNVPIFPSLVFISAPIIGVTALLCWATIHNRRGFVTRFPNRPTEDGMLLFEDDRPGLYEIWIENNFDSPYRDLEGRDPPMQIRDPHGKLGDPRSLLIQLPLALELASSESLPNHKGDAEHDTLATLIRMPHRFKLIGGTTTEEAVHEPEAEVLLGTSPIRIADAG